MSSEQTRVHPPPRGFKDKLKWLGPGFLWMVSAAGSGELLFTPRVGAMYGYALLWALLAAVILKWFINREIGRYSVCTGKTIIDGFAELPGPRNWAIYLILIPQIFVAVTSIAGLTGSAATALILALPGDIRIWAIATTLSSTALVLFGKFKGVEKAATILAVVLGISSIVAAATVFPNVEKLGAGIVPKIPEQVKIEEILPWLGFMLSGAAGLIWYSFWVLEKGYGVRKNSYGSKKFTKAEIGDIKSWLKQMTADTSVAVIGTTIVTIAFLILGAELLKPNGLVPDENQVAETLGKMLEHLWGRVGFWFMVSAVFVGFWDTVLSDQDGFGRMFAGGTKRLLSRVIQSKSWLSEKKLQRAFVIVLVTMAPIILYLVMGNPVELLKIAGAIEACHIPIVVAVVLYLNHKSLPEELRPSTITFIFTAVAGLFFAGFAAVYLMQVL
jgi:Mn2+/Fe2+ NRAMP family transporter